MTGSSTASSMPRLSLPCHAHATEDIGERGARSCYSKTQQVGGDSKIPVNAILESWKVGWHNCNLAGFLPPTKFVFICFQRSACSDGLFFFSVAIWTNPLRTEVHMHSPPAKKGRPTKPCSWETLRETNAVYPRYQSGSGLVETRRSPLYHGESGRFDKQKLLPCWLPCLQPIFAARTENLMTKSKGWLVGVH